MEGPAWLLVRAVAGNPTGFASTEHHDHDASHSAPPSSATKLLSARNRTLQFPRGRRPQTRSRGSSTSPHAAALPPAPDSVIQVLLGFRRRFQVADFFLFWSMVVVRIRPLSRVDEEEAGEDVLLPEACMRKTAVNSLAIQGQDFMFDAFDDAMSTQRREFLRGIGC